MCVAFCLILMVRMYRRLETYECVAFCCHVVIDGKDVQET